MLVGFGFRALEFGRVGRWPVRRDRLTRPSRTRFGRVVADGDYEVKAHPAEFIPALAARVGGIDLKGVL